MCMWMFFLFLIHFEHICTWFCFIVYGVQSILGHTLNREFCHEIARGIVRIFYPIYVANCAKTREDPFQVLSARILYPTYMANRAKTCEDPVQILEHNSNSRLTKINMTSTASTLIWQRCNENMRECVTKKKCRALNNAHNDTKIN